VKLRKTCCHLILGLKHHQQSGEAAVRDMGICTRTRRSEVSASPLTTFRSFVISNANHKIRNINDNRTLKANYHRDSEGAPLSKQAEKRDRVDSDKKKSARVRPTKNAIVILINECLSMSVFHDPIRYRKSKKRARCAELVSSKETIMRMKTEKRALLISRRTTRRDANFRVVDATNITPVISHTPLRYDGRVRVSSLRKKVMIGFVKLQLAHRQVSFGENEGITALINKLRGWVENEERGRVGPNAALTANTDQVIEIILSDSPEKDSEGVEWTIALVHERSKNK